MTSPAVATGRAVVIGGGPAGLIAAEELAGAGLQVTVVEAMPSVGRKLLLAGRGGLNLTHSEPIDQFLARYPAGADVITDTIRAAGPTQLREWSAGLGQPTFVGSSGRVFPEAFRAAPLLRAWRTRLDELGVTWLLRHRWHGWDCHGLVVQGPAGRVPVPADVTVLALGGASWPRTGSDGSWTTVLRERGIRIAPLRVANGGFEVAWSATFAERFAGTPLKNVRLSCGRLQSRGEAMITTTGIEGGAVYAIGAEVRDAIERDGSATIDIDLQPDLDDARFAARLARARPGDSMANRLRRAGLSPVAAGLVRETGAGCTGKRVTVRALAVQPIARAISTAGGIALDEVDTSLMLRKIPGVFTAGEMLDWEAPTGGYLLQACFSTGLTAGRSAATWVTRTP